MKCELPGGTIHYEERGEGRPLVLLHGMTLDHRIMVGSFEPILEQRTGWRRIYPDLPGMGRTGAINGVTSQDQVLDLVLAFVDRVIGAGSFCVGGLSYGGLLAQGIAHRHPERLDGLLLVVTSMGILGEYDLPEARVLIEEPLDATGVEAGELAAFNRMAVVRTRAHLERWKEEILPPGRMIDRTFLTRLRRRYRFSFDLTRLPTPFEKPTLFLLGRQDTTCGYRDAWRTLENYPRATFAVLDGAGHCLSYEQPKLFASLVDEWLDRVEAALRLRS